MLKTEARNPNTMHIDTCDTRSIISLINEENFNAVRAVEKASDDIAAVCDCAAKCIENGGRIFYIGAGTSGRLGVLDAAECPPTFGVDTNTVIGIIAGGERCMCRAAEGEEDDENAGIADIKKYDITKNDIVIGISAAGGAKYVCSALKHANQNGAVTVSLSSNFDTAIEKEAKMHIITDTGAEVVTGSTRMKAGTAQKLVLNMISTTAMIKTGKVYENMMINLKPSNIKLKNRVIRIVCEIKHCSEDCAVKLLEDNGWDIRKAVSK